jgi:hypothetical protein
LIKTDHRDDRVDDPDFSEELDRHEIVEGRGIAKTRGTLAVA